MLRVPWTERRRDKQQQLVARPLPSHVLQWHRAPATATSATRAAARATASAAAPAGGAATAPGLAATRAPSRAATAFSAAVATSVGWAGLRPGTRLRFWLSTALATALAHATLALATATCAAAAAAAPHRSAGLADRLRAPRCDPRRCCGGWRLRPRWSDALCVAALPPWREQAREKAPGAARRREVAARGAASRGQGAPRQGRGLEEAQELTRAAQRAAAAGLRRRV